jgi:hypothetical protein
MIRLRDYAKALGVCKKTALAQALREGMACEKRPVRGGWAWFVAAKPEAAQAPVDTGRLEQCISLALKIDSSANGAARLAVRLYEVL